VTGSGRRKGTVVSRRTPLIVAVVAVVFLGACGRRNGGAAPGQTPDNAPPLAEVDGRPITAEHFRTYLGKDSDTAGRSQESRKRLLDTLVRFEVMAKEAADLGYERDPAVVRAHKQEMISRMIQDHIRKASGAEPSQQDMERYFATHRGDLFHPERIRARHIFVRDRSRAAAVVAAVKALPRSDDRAFIELVSRFSEDSKTRDRGGDLGVFDRDTRSVPRPIVDAAFRLKAVHDVSDMVATAEGFHVIQLSQRIAESGTTMSEVRDEIQRRMAKELTATKVEAFTKGIQTRHRVRLFPDNLRTLDPTASRSGVR
jgi:peptidyl-prolyl cis-trans isomerase C